jgi:cupin fold WbuC family metalloprotein
MQRIDLELMDRVAGEAGVSPRGRKNYNFHREYSDPLQRLLNAIDPYSYIQPHKHEDPDKVEAFVVLRGRLLVLEFDPDGRITESAILDPLTGSHGAEIPPRTFHMIIALEPGTIVYEVKNGPYSPIDDKNFAPWAPKEGDPATRAYIDTLLQTTNLR